MIAAFPVVVLLTVFNLYTVVLLIASSVRFAYSCVSLMYNTLHTPVVGDGH